VTDRTVFHDPSGRRKRWLVRFAAVGGGIAIVVSVVFILSLIFLPVFPPSPAVPENVRRALVPGLPKVTERAQRMRHFLLARVRRDLLLHIAQDERAKKAPAAAAVGNNIVAAFYATWQETGLHSLRANAGRITHLMPVWLAITPDGAGIDFRDWDPALTPHNLEVVGLAHDHHMQIWPVLSNAERKRFDRGRAHRLLTSIPAQEHLATDLRDWLRDRHFQGVNVDLENLDAGDSPRVPAFLARLRAVLAPAGLGLSFDIQSTDETLDWKALAEPCDFVMVEGYDEHGMVDQPGPISSTNWYREVLVHAVEKIPPAKLVMGLGNYAYDWPEGGGEAESMSYLEALLRARDRRMGEPPDSVVNFDPAALNPTYNYVDDAGKDHEVWMLDGVTVGNQMRLARALGVQRFALWALGLEDPSVWTLLGAAHQDSLPSLDGLKTIAFPYDVEFLGDGEILTVAEHPKTGHRELDIDPLTGICTDEAYHDYPTSFVLRRTGYLPKTLAITFDDGPYSPWTAVILDSLHALNVPATFFVIGQNADREPDLVQRMWDEGHEVGNHSFTHPNLGQCSTGRTRLELVATQRSIEAILGRSTRLFRPPYNADAEPTSAEEVKPIEIASDLGYYTVGEYLDPQDWNLKEETPDGSLRTRTAADIANAVLEDVHTGHGNTILLHDGGGDRSRTAAALRLFVPVLQREGYAFVTVSQLIQAPRAQVMPPINPNDELLIGGDRIAFNTLYGIENFLTFAFLAAIALGTARVIFILTLALIARRRERRIDPTVPPATSVSVLIAAYNEHTVIGRTVHAVLASEPPPLEVVVVDDGSTDGTSEALHGAIGDDPRVRLVRQENQGKAAALNHALSLARGEIVVCLDADTQFVPDTIAQLTRHFADSRVAAVAGNVKVGNRVNLLTYWQAIEYISSQNLDRRAFAFLNAVTVVPGACGAWRRQAMAEVGGLSSDTLAEDMDLTWRLRRAGWRIENEPHAIAYTEAPETLNSLFRQRFRWAFGTLQCLWKHRAALGRTGAFGLLMMPSLWLFQIMFPVLSPIIDVQVAITLFRFGQTWLTQSMLTREWQPMPAALAMLNHVVFMYAFFLLIELLGAAVAFLLDRERKRLLWWVLWQRFVYRQIMYAVVLRSVQTAIAGLRTGWGKVERRGSVGPTAYRARQRTGGSPP
jgi:poly-beta-1,6 N-acetyl-D-glucosamine synthase